MRSTTGALLMSLGIAGCGAAAPVPRVVAPTVPTCAFGSNANAPDAFPHEAFGFRFGSTPEDAEHACLEAGGTWSESGLRGDRHGYCRAGFAELDQLASVGAWYCGEPRAVCAVTLATDAADAAAIARVFTQLANVLWDRYGDPLDVTPLDDACAPSVVEQDTWHDVLASGCEVEMIWSPPGGAIRVHVSNDGASSGAVVDVSYFATGAVEELSAD